MAGEAGGADRARAGGAREPAVTDFVPLFKALCNGTRAHIVDFLLDGERCVCEMTGPLDLSQPLVSHHLGLLRQAGLVRVRHEGSRTYYSLDAERFASLLEEFTASRRRGRRPGGLSGPGRSGAARAL